MSSEDVLKDEVISLKLKLKADKVARKKDAEDYGRMAGELIKLQKIQEELQTEKNQLTLKNVELNEKLISVQESIVSCTLLTTLYTPHYIVHSSLHCTLLTRWCLFCV